MLQILALSRSLRKQWGSGAVLTGFFPSESRDVNYRLQHSPYLGVSLNFLLNCAAQLRRNHEVSRPSNFFNFKYFKLPCIPLGQPGARLVDGPSVLDNIISGVTNITVLDPLSLCVPPERSRYCPIPIRAQRPFPSLDLSICDIVSQVWL